jgi:hypothetical protein
MSNKPLLCSAIRQSIDSIVMDWINRVKADSYIQSDNPLTLVQIVDHIPQMLEELCKLLEQEEEPNFKTVQAASSHGYARSLSGYSLTELIRELELLRDCIFNFVAETESKHGVSYAETIRDLRLVNKYFGEDIIFVVEHYLKQKTT